MDKIEVVNKIKEIGVVAVIRGNNPEEAVAMSEACIKGGVTAIELAFTTPRAHEAIRELAKKYADNPDVVIGAGTVLDAVTARIAILEGAEFVVSPALDVETIKLCNRYRVAVMPGTTTLKDVVTALECGADVVKIFPGEVVGMKLSKPSTAPCRRHRSCRRAALTSTMPVNGLRPAASLSVPAELTGGGKTADEITETAKKFIAAVKAVRE